MRYFMIEKIIKNDKTYIHLHHHMYFLNVNIIVDKVREWHGHMYTTKQNR